MNYQLKAVIIKNLKKLEDLFVETPILIPKPKEIRRGKDEKPDAFILNNDCNISFINISNKKHLNDDLTEILQQLSSIKLKQVDPDDSDNKLLESKIEWDLLDVNNEEGYNLEIINGRILIYGLYEKGLFYGIQTLVQIIKNVYLSNPNIATFSKRAIDKFILPEIEIKDVPDLKIRGIAQDISRGQVFTVENAKRYIKILSHYKMNFYCAYIEDMFLHPKHPLIGKERGALTVKEIKEIDNYAKERYIEFVPIFECFGHVDNILMLKEYEHLGEFPGAQCLDISNPDIYTFLENFISELSGCFSTKYFHIGCDESFDFGKVRSKDYINKNGKSEVITNFYNQVYHMCRENMNRYVIMYDDIVRRNKEILKNLNKDIILMYWYYGTGKKDSVVKKLLNAGHRVIVSPSMMNWQRNFPDNITSNRNIINLIKSAYKYRNHGCLGVLTSTWGDMRYYSFRENEIFGAILTAAVAWTTPNFNLEELKMNYAFLFYGINKDKLAEFKTLFNLLSSSTLCIYRFSKLFPPLFYTYFFKHPFPVQKVKPTFSKYRELGEIGIKSKEVYPFIQSQVIFEKENFEYIEFGAELASFLQEKIDTSIRVSNRLLNPEITDQDIQICIKDLDKIKEKTIYLKEKYEKLWLRAAKRPNLDVILNLFDFLINCYTEKNNQIQEKVFFKDPYLSSEWIWARETKSPAKPRYFRKIIEINQPVKQALIQGISSNDMKIFVNGEYIGEVFSRFSMSILPIINRVKVFDITKKLEKGKNVIAIEAYNYQGFKGAINIFGQIQLKDDTIQEILTDKTWLTNKKDIFENDDWLKVEFKDPNWKPAKSYGRPPNLNGDIFTPDLLNGEISITQDYFGTESYFWNAIDVIAGGLFGKIGKALTPIGIKLLKPYGN